MNNFEKSLAKFQNYFASNFLTFFVTTQFSWKITLATFNSKITNLWLFSTFFGRFLRQNVLKSVFEHFTVEKCVSQIFGRFWRKKNSWWGFLLEICANMNFESLKILIFEGQSFQEKWKIGRAVNQKFGIFELKF